MRIQLICPCGQAHTLDLEKDTKFKTGAGNACGIEEKTQPMGGGGCEPLPAEVWKMRFIASDESRHDAQIEAGRLREELKREKNCTRAYQEKIQQELNDEVARRNNLAGSLSREQETSKGLSVQVRDLENERTVLTFALSEKQKKLDEARRAVEQPAKPEIQEWSEDRKRMLLCLEDRRKRVLQVEAECQELRTSLASAKHEISELNEELERRGQMLTLLRGDLKTLQKHQTATEVNEEQGRIKVLQIQLDEARAEINRLVNAPPKSKDAETIYDLRIELSQAQRQLTKIRSIANELRKQP